jgi:hypothetical protein
VDQLMEMGFCRARVAQALAQARGDPSAAMELLLVDIA